MCKPTSSAVVGTKSLESQRKPLPIWRGPRLWGLSPSQKQEAEEWLKELGQKLPESSEHPDSEDAEGYLNRGLAFYDKGDLDQAIADYDQAIALDT